MNGRIRRAQCPTFDGEWEIARGFFRQQLFQSPRPAVAGAMKRHATISLGFQGELRGLQEP